MGDEDIPFPRHLFGVSMKDVLIRSGTQDWMPPLLAIPGAELSGFVEGIGSGVTELSRGQRVIVSARKRVHRGACYTEYIVAPSCSVLARPDSADLEQAATLANYQVADHLLKDCARGPGPNHLIYGAARRIGIAIIDLYRHLSVAGIGVRSGPSNVTFLRTLEILAVVDRSSENVAYAVRITTGHAASISDLIQLAD